MNKDAVIRDRVESDLKEHAEAVFRRLGVSTTQAIAQYASADGVNATAKIHPVGIRDHERI